MTHPSTNHGTPVTLTAEQVARLSELVEGAIFCTTSHLVSQVKFNHPHRDAVEMAKLIESDRRLTVALSRVAVTA